MKILMVMPMPPDPKAPGATPIVLYSEMVGLGQLHDISIVTLGGFEPGEKETIKQLSTSNVRAHILFRQRATGQERLKRIWRLGTAWAKGYLPWRTIWFWEPALQNILDDLFAQENFDLIIIDDNAMANYDYPRSIPTIFNEHEVRKSRGIDWSGLWAQNPLHWIYREMDWARWPRYERSVWRKFERIQVFTDKDAASMKELAPDLAAHIRVNPFGIELPTPADASQEQEYTLLFTGNFTHSPNVDAALWLGHEIMPQILKEIPQAKLTLIGIYPPKEILALHGQGIDVLGPVPEIEPYENKASLILAPVRIGGGMRMKVLHSMAMGKAVLTTPRGAEGLAFASEHPPLVTAESAQEFAQSAICLLRDRSVRQRLGCEAREYIGRHFTASAYARRIEDIYQEMVKGQRNS